MKFKRQSLKTTVVKTQSFFVYPKLVTFMLLLTLLLLLSRIYFSNQLAVSGVQVSYYETKASQLQQENYQIENEISKKTSMSYINTKAQEAGMVKVNKLEVIQPTTPVAFNQ